MNNKYRIESVSIRPLPGSDIDETIEEAVALSLEKFCAVTFNFNGVYMLIDIRPYINKLSDGYRTQLSKE